MEIVMKNCSILRVQNVHVFSDAIYKGKHSLCDQKINLNLLSVSQMASTVPAEI